MKSLKWIWNKIDPLVGVVAAVAAGYVALHSFGPIGLISIPVAFVLFGLVGKGI